MSEISLFPCLSQWSFGVQLAVQMTFSFSPGLLSRSCTTQSYLETLPLHVEAISECVMSLMRKAQRGYNLADDPHENSCVDAYKESEEAPLDEHLKLHWKMQFIQRM
jgi:hypothetical protein